MVNPSGNKFKQKSLLKIGEASQVLGVSINTLRRWEKKGKINAVRTPGNTRLYSTQSIRLYQHNPVSTEELLKKTETGIEENTEKPEAISSLNTQYSIPDTNLFTKFLISGVVALSLDF